MNCEECGKIASIRFFVPTNNPVRRLLNNLSQNLNEGTWVCEECLKNR